MGWNGCGTIEADAAHPYIFLTHISPISHILQWSLSFLYDLSVGGSFTVSMRHRLLRRCAPLELTDQYIVLCILIGVLAFIYEVSMHQYRGPSVHPLLTFGS